MAETAGVNGRLLIRIDERTTTILERQKKADEKLDKLSDKVGDMTATYAECSAIQGQRWEAHEKVHEQLRPKRDQTIIDIVLGAMVVGLGALGISTKS